MIPDYRDSLIYQMPIYQMPIYQDTALYQRELSSVVDFAEISVRAKQ
jgi:hypothetical protein